MEANSINDIFDIKKQWSFIRVLKVELQSLLGRLFFRFKPKLSDKNYLNLCCGKNAYPNWVNVDFYFSKSLHFWRPKSSRPNWRVDIRYALKCPDNVIDGIFSEHTLEHINHANARRLLRELFRIMKPGAYIRIGVPDLEKYINYYHNRELSGFENRFKSGAEAIANITQNWYHLSVWDSELLERELRDAGFTNFMKCDFQQGRCQELLKDDILHLWETLYVEAQKPKFLLQQRPKK